VEVPELVNLDEVGVVAGQHEVGVVFEEQVGDVAQVHEPVQLGVIFLSNLELGYLTPPVGMNLCLSAYRFQRPMASIYRATLPFYLILFAGVLLITYVPWITMAPVHWLEGR